LVRGCFAAIFDMIIARLVNIDPHFQLFRGPNKAVTGFAPSETRRRG
jgi:hypothetical protein